jgi:hypothetical protein
MRSIMAGSLLVSLAGLVVSCSGSSKKTADLPRPEASDAGPALDANPDRHIPTISGPARLLEGRYFVDQGAPHPIACTQDKDCIGDTVPDETGCCVRSSDAYPQTFAWHAWSTRRRLSPACDEVKCPPLPVPSMPEVCRLNVECEAGVCRNTCTEQPEPPPPEGQPLQEPDQEEEQRQEQAPQK